MKFITAILVSIVFLCLSRLLNAKANYYANKRDTQFRKGDIKKPTKYVQLNNWRYVLISAFCQEKRVAVKVLVMAILEIAIEIFMGIAALLLKFCSLIVPLVIVWVMGVVALNVVLGFANFNDRLIWTGWGTKRK